ncbi:MAG: hypothetical protein ABIC91_00545 [Nanoarchaeota archaeon]|nr:hypothetical protein [Nanoarchaeota archaeon]MBU1029747.1 hypothetical protein [Nanoarchaeota archaeon]MBU1849269.1 hypothetical protein [Nanoarchaeota archaeon]
MINPKIIIICPTSNHKCYCLKEFLKGLNRLTYANCEVLFADNSKDASYAEMIRTLGCDCIKIPFTKGVKKRLANSRDLLRKKALLKDCEYVLSIEQDIIPPKDVIEKLLSCKKRVVSAFYTKNMLVKDNDVVLGREDVPVLWILNDEKTAVKRLRMKDVGGKKIFQIHGGGLGCLLIHKNVLEKITFRIGEDEKGFDDMYFFRDLQEQNIPAFCDATIKCRHLEMIWNKETRVS